MAIASIQHESPLSVVDVVAQMRRFSEEWRESKLPSDVREAGVYACTVKLNPPDFTMTVEGAAAQRFQLTGVIESTTTGSVILGNVQIANSSVYAMFGILVVAVSVAVVTAVRGGGFGGILPAMLIVPLWLAMTAGAIQRRRAEAEAQFRRILAAMLSPPGQHAPQ